MLMNLRTRRTFVASRENSSPGARTFESAEAAYDAKALCGACVN
jgi:hypothetical protein